MEYGQNCPPSPAVGLVTLNGTDVVGLSVVVLGDDLGNIDGQLDAIADDCLPGLASRLAVSFQRHTESGMCSTAVRNIANN